MQVLEKIGTHECRQWSSKIFSRHCGVDQYLKSVYIRTAGEVDHRAANDSLRILDEKLKFVGEGSAALDDDSIQNLASIRAIQAKGFYKAMAIQSHVARIGWQLIEFCENAGVEFPIKITRNDSESDIMQKIINASERVSDERWWRRKLRTAMGRQTESVLRESGFVRAGKAPYLSNWAFSRWKSAQLRNKNILSGLEAITHDDDGNEINYELQDCIDSSISNPVNRRNELMVRMRGYEEVATGLGLVGLFFTLTTPSKFHAQHYKGGINKKFKGETPLDAMKHLNKTWSLIRAEWARKGIKAFGFRVAEPHHDGTPHFHFLLFVNPEEREQACEIFGNYALAIDGSEAGAQEQRWDVKIISPEKGTAAGYIAKYVAKNLDGYSVGMDEEGDCLGEDGALRARAWASLWGIRQFQQIGSVSVTVWRELRRKREIFDDMTPEEVEPLRAAADSGDWCEFVELMGGAFVRRDDQTLRPAYMESETVQSRYGEGVKRLIGVWLKPVARALGRCMVSTRDKVWVIRERSVRSIKEASPPPWTCVNNCTEEKVNG